MSVRALSLASRFRHCGKLVAATLIVALVVISSGCKRDGAVVSSGVNTSLFDGRYQLVAEESFAYSRAELAAAEDAAEQSKTAGELNDPQLASKIKNLQMLLAFSEERYENFTIRNGIIRSGRVLVQEFSLRRAEIEGDTLIGVALWHEDVGDPGDCHEVRVWLKLTGDRLEFSIGDPEEGFGDPVILDRLPSEG